MVPTWAELQATYNYQTLPERHIVLVGLVCEEAGQQEGARQHVRALDIGCGNALGGLSSNTTPLMNVRSKVHDLWGVEPDPNAAPDMTIYDRIFRSTLEDLDTGNEKASLAYSYLVQEHIDDADAFLRAVYAHLDEGGVYFGMTINARHFFAIIARLLHVLRLDEWVLRTFLSGPYGLGYHYPVRYRCNDARRIAQAATAAGFAAPTFATMEGLGDAEHYFLGPLRFLYSFLQWKRRTFRRPQDLLTLIVRLEKPRTGTRP